MLAVVSPTFAGYIYQEAPVGYGDIALTQEYIPYQPTRTLAVKIELPPRLSKEENIAIITKYAAIYGIPVEQFLAVAQCESGFNNYAVGDKSKGYSYGLFQIHYPAHKIGKALAFNSEWSTRWAAKKWLENPRIWSCYKLLGYS